MGETSVVSISDAFATFGNAGKLPFVKSKLGGAITYTPWLSNLVGDMYLAHLGGYLRLDSVQTLGAGFTYFNLGEFEINDLSGDFVDQFDSYETQFQLSYARKLSSRLGLGLTGKYVRSDLPGKFALLEDLRVGHGAAVDLGLYYRFPAKKNRQRLWSLGVQIANLGPKISYDGGQTSTFLPANLQVGVALEQTVAEEHCITVASSLEKLLVPTPPLYVVSGDADQIQKGKDPDRPLLSGVFGSFADAPDGFNEELKEVMASLGMEYLYRDLLAVRCGYHHQHRQKGARQYLTFGVGIALSNFSLNFSYLLPTTANHPLSKTLRLTLAMQLI